MQRTIEYIVGFTILIMAQIFIFDNINILGYVNPFIYIMFVIMLPMQINHSLLILLGFLSGMLMDALTGGGGICMITATALAFLRPIILTITAGRDVISAGGMPTETKLGRNHFLIFITLMTITYNTPYFMLEKMTFDDFSHTALRIVFSTIFTVFVIYLCHLPLKSREIKWL